MVDANLPSQLLFPILLSGGEILLLRGMKRISYFFFILGLSACAPEIRVAEPDSGFADLRNPIIFGGSTMAGYRDGALYLEAQKTSVGRMLLDAFSEVENVSFYSWEVESGNGLGDNFRNPALPFRSRGVLANLSDCEGVVSLGAQRQYYSMAEATTLLNPLLQTELSHNLAIPFSNVKDWTDPNFSLPIGSGGRNAYYPRIASQSGISTLFSDALSLSPTFFVMWPGLEEILNWAITGAESNEAPSGSDFNESLDSLLFRLVSTGAKGVLADIPPLDALPFFTTFPSLGLEIDSVKADSLNLLYSFPPFDEIRFHEGKNGFVIEDVTTASGYRLSRTTDRLLLITPKDSIKCKKWGVVFTPLPDTVVLDSAELEMIHLRIESFNQSIQSLAQKYNLPIAKVGDFYSDLLTGYIVDGISFNSTFVSGGFFSLDGLNPTAKGAALVANQFIKTINTFYEARIPTRVVSQFEGLRFP